MIFKKNQKIKVMAQMMVSVGDDLATPEVVKSLMSEVTALDNMEVMYVKSNEFEGMYAAKITVEESAGSMKSRLSAIEAAINQKLGGYKDTYTFTTSLTAAQ